ncbi:PilZ domain-containing protein [Allosphingosinicella vermicomposti]|uniref:PilZ domain-containing protein n=1 Tax=Allosphingosinicella vermicomposti TaxID=614671 RepID=UPI000D10406B|nr:PilZ domain-containing protein [Allosphingosinicella vermicomposti]
MTLGDWIKRAMGRGAGEDELSFETACVQLTTQIPRPTDRRADPRVLPFLPIARLERAMGESLCRIRNISAGGMMAQCADPLEADEAVTIEVHSDRRIPARVAWIREGNAGFRFDAAVDVRTIFSSGRPRIGYRPRPPRMEISCAATIRIAGIFHHVTIEDISAGGMKVALPKRVRDGTPVIVTVDHLKPVRGRIRWWKDGIAGIAFDRMLPFEDLILWLGKRIEIASVMGAARRP